MGKWARRIAAGMAVCGTVVAPAFAATLDVTTFSQEQPPVTNGNCTLSEAMTAANNDAPVDACSPRSGTSFSPGGADHIFLASGVYSLTGSSENVAGAGATGLPPIASEIHLHGTPTTVIERAVAASSFRLFRVTASGFLSIWTATLRGGRTASAVSPDGDGAAILCAGHLMLTDTKVDFNHATNNGGAIAIVGSGFALIQTSRLATNTADRLGGGIMVETTAAAAATQVLRSRLTGNSASAGSALSIVGGVADAVVVVTESTIDANTSGNEGAVHVFGTGDLTVESSTLAGNTTNGAGAGIYAATGAVVAVLLTTITANTADANGDGLEAGGGVHVAGAVTLTNSVIRDNSALGGGSADCSGVAMSGAGKNLIGTGCTTSGGVTVPGMAMLLPLAEYGGPTPTCAPSAGSAVIDAGASGSCLPTDQRGVGRVGVCDLGAVEYTFCGDGVVQSAAGETCDAGGANSDTAKDACRASCLPASCGDGVVDSGEACDDHNLDDGDGCGSGCTVTAATGPTGATSATGSFVDSCGDGSVDEGEECDDGTANADETPNACRTSCRRAFCGDGVIDEGEQCDRLTACQACRVSELTVIARGCSGVRSEAAFSLSVVASLWLLRRCLGRRRHER
ncbi:MAG: hypothetical protein IT381_19180 [Deltaproteobacteria bacterium]|nr:hypothetical protein [Deltaproteobacteria bacterium]